MRNTVDAIKTATLILVGPVGCYIAYNSLFVLRYLGGDAYPHLNAMYGPSGVAIEAACMVGAIVVSAFLTWWLRPYSGFEPRKDLALAAPFLAAICIGVTGLMWLSLYRIMGNEMWSNFGGLYMRYHSLATNGSAWMILACYAAIYILLIDMYASGLRAANSAAFFYCVALTSISGGRGLLMLFILTYLLLLVLQSERLRTFMLYGLLGVLAIFAVFVVPSSLRMTGTVDINPVVVFSGPSKPAPNLAPTETWQDLNYNAAFITDDVLAGLQSGKVSPSSYALEDISVLFVPRAWYPDKPISSAETRALYPHVAERGSNITLPLKANLMMHLGAWAFYLDWLIVLAAQIALILGLRTRSSGGASFSGFFFVFWGLGFLLIARGGLLNARLIPQVLLIAAAYAGYQAAMAIQRALQDREKTADAI